MKTKLMRAAAAALIATLAAGVVLPGGAVAKPKGKPPISNSPPPMPFKLGPVLKCSVEQTGRQRKIRIANSLNRPLPKYTRIYWQATRTWNGWGAPGSISGVITLHQAFGTSQSIYRNVPSTIIRCRARIIRSIYR